MFPGCERGDFRHSARHPIESLIGVVRTHSNLRVANAAERAEDVERMRAFLTTQPETSSGEFDFPFRTLTYRGKRVVTA